jgi:UDP-N-acetylglucosamine/UDP-N-acetylgalactosamine diphosphorylase
MPERSMKKARVSSLEDSLRNEEQEHILGLFPSLPQDEEHPLHKQLLSVDISGVRHALRSSQAVIADEAVVTPVSEIIDWSSIDEDTKEDVVKIGYDALGRGSCAAVILSGGQGTRLGFNGPKGMFNFGMPSSKTIFQLHIEKIQRLRHLTAINGSLPYIPVYIMTSDLNDKVISDYFKDSDYFGYPENDMFFFQQDLMPCITPDGKLIVESETSLAQAPCGNGGIYAALEKSGALVDMESRGVKHLHIYGIDNVLTKSLDPGFLGLCIKHQAECGNKVVWRASKSEKVGVTAEKGSRLTVVEYSDIPPALAEAQDYATGKLIFGAANICNHYFSLAFIKNKVIGSSLLTYHIANKKIPYLDSESRETVAPRENNGIKLELFIFDVFCLADRWLVVEVCREDEFAPVKNEPGNPNDSPDTARQLISLQAKRWLKAAGAKLSGAVDSLCEISPLVSYAGEGLEKFAGTEISLPCSLT